MGRHKKYTTEEQRLAADRADKRRWYQKVKEEKKQVFRLRSLRNYYNNKLKTLTEDTPEELNRVRNKINELNEALDNLSKKQS